MNIIFTILYGIIIIAFLIVELSGVYNTKRSGDTLSEHVWWIQKKWPVMRWVVAAFCIWLLIHFFFFGKIA